MKEYGGTTKDTAVRELAALQFALEECQSAIVVHGGSQQANDLVRLSNLVSRKQREMKAAAGNQPTRAPSLDEYLAGSHG
jgi:acetylglutamate kinase